MTISLLLLKVDAVGWLGGALFVAAVAWAVAYDKKKGGGS